MHFVYPISQVDFSAFSRVNSLTCQCFDPKHLRFAPSLEQTDVNCPVVFSVWVQVGNFKFFVVLILCPLLKRKVKSVFGKMKFPSIQIAKFSIKYYLLMRSYRARIILYVWNSAFF